MSQKMGIQAEQYACDYLVSQGLKWIASNYRCRMGEIDLIMRDGDIIVFIEVRARVSSAFGGAIASVTSSKQQKLIKTALQYLSANKLKESHAIRFDVLALQGKEPPQVTWLQNAFGSNF